MVNCMPPTSRHRKILIASLFILLMALFSNTCLAATHEYTYKLLDNPDGSKNYRLTVAINETLYETYINKTHRLYNYDFSKFVTPDALKPIADDLWNIYNNEEDFANGVLMIVHQIPYVESDPQKYPVETIVENEGDCDLFSIIAASIMKAGGLDVVLLYLEWEDHMLLGVHLPESPKDARSTVYFYRYQEKKYYVAETTGGNWENGWRVGECPEILQRAVAKVIPLANYEREAPEQVSSICIVPDSSALRMILSTSFLVSRNDIKISGSLSPSLGGENVTLYVGSMGSPLTLLTTIVTGPDGTYSHTWESPPSGIYSVRATWAGDENYYSADSSTFRLIVIPAELLTLGLIVIFCLVILIAVRLATRGSIGEEPENFEELEFPDDPEYF